MLTEEILAQRLDGELAELARLVGMFGAQEMIAGDARRWLDTRLLQQATKLCQTRELLTLARNALPFIANGHPRLGPSYERPEA